MAGSQHRIGPGKTDEKDQQKNGPTHGDIDCPIPVAEQPDGDTDHTDCGQRDNQKGVPRAELFEQK